MSRDYDNYPDVRAEVWVSVVRAFNRSMEKGFGLTDKPALDDVAWEALQRAVDEQISRYLQRIGK